MKHLFYFFLLSLPLVYSCNPSATQEPEAEQCTDGSPTDQLNCQVGGTWRLVSVTSDVARPVDAGGTTRDWLEFRPECYQESLLDFRPFAGNSTEGVTGFYEFRNTTDSCPDSFSTIETDPEFESATVLVDQDASLYFYGIETETGATSDTWYDIRVVTGESLKYRVDKTLDDIDYQLSVEYERVE
ncbi:hypothetical protein [Lewinella sp. IMCC34191]|uniref:hypothetical protein n=1 Tax=Lewinella sp. IMCC34191 TaxID=2259172 RepID=UPI000E279CC2|nr:hypothetical protein [Lewinella sp. IMCC34191]